MVEMLNSINNLKSNIVDNIRRALDSIGLMYRLFDRIKTHNSITRKLESDSSYGSTKLLQDLIGIRIVLYFTDDVSIVRDVLKNLFAERTEDQSIDEPGMSNFHARRYNLVFAHEDESWNDIKKSLKGKVDNTFELQIRTVFSEGWHEVEHDLKYKFKGDWTSVPEFTRNMNGVLASLEINELTMLRILDDLSYSHYKQGNVIEMFRQKLRLRLQAFDLSHPLLDIFSDPTVLKSFHRLNRQKLLESMATSEFRYPLTLENVIYFANYVFIQDSRIIELTPMMLIEELSEIFDQKDGLTQVEIAKRIATAAHDGQKRRDGSPYISHSERVASMLTQTSEIAAAWLHDVIEDTNTVEADLQQNGVEKEVIRAVNLLTKRNDCSYEDYIEAISLNSIARRVKICDLLHNLSDAPKPEKVAIYANSLKKLLLLK